MIGKAANIINTLENVAIANTLQLQAARAMPVLSRFNYDVMPSLKSPNLLTAVLYDVTLTSDLEHLRCIACDVMKLCNQI